MSGVFTFCPNSQVPETVPRESASVVTLGSWTFTARPSTPYTRKFKVKLHGLYWYLNNDGTYNTTKNPTINARLLELFYQANEMWDNFTYNHPHLGAIQCRFGAPVQVPAGKENSFGLIEAYEIVLLEHNPSW